MACTRTLDQNGNPTHIWNCGGDWQGAVDKGNECGQNQIMFTPSPDSPDETIYYINTETGSGSGC